MAQVTFGPKSQWQKRDCINRSADYNCPNESTLEARIGKGFNQVKVRCCEDQACMDRASEEAQVAYNKLVEARA